MGWACVFKTCLIKIFAHQVQLLQDTLTQNCFRVGGKARTGRASIRSITKLNDAVAAVVGGLGVHPIAFHQRDFGKIIWCKFILPGQTQNLVMHGLLFLWGNETLVHGTVQGLLQNRVSRAIEPSHQLNLGGCGQCRVGIRCAAAQKRRHGVQRRRQTIAARCLECIHAIHLIELGL